MTQEELVKTPMFRVIRQGLMRKYPWIKNVIVAFPEDLDKYEHVWFVDAVIDLEKLQETEELGDLTYWMRLHPDWFRQASTLSVYFQDATKADEVGKDVEEQVRSIQNNPTVKDLKLRKTILLSQFLNRPPDTVTMPN